MQPVVINEGRPPWMRWLAIPAALLVIVLIALAIDTETRDDYIERVQVQERQEERFEDPEATRLFFETEDGEVVEFSLDDGEPLGRDSDGEISSISIRPDPDGKIVGLIVNDDGTFVPYEIGEDVSDKTVVVPNIDGGFTLVRPDGSRVDINIGPDGVEATDSDGNPLELDEDGDGRIDLGDGLGAREADVELGNGQALPEVGDQDSPGSSGPGLGSGRNLIILFVGLAALAGAVWWFVAMKPKFRLQEVVGGDVPPVAYQPNVPAPSALGAWDAFEAFLQELLGDQDPTRAIRDAYAYAEQGIGRLPPRGQEQTPFEWCTSIESADQELGTLLRSLTNRYSAIRFADEIADGAERDAAVQELRVLVRQACT